MTSIYGKENAMFDLVIILHIIYLKNYFICNTYDIILALLRYHSMDKKVHLANIWWVGCRLTLRQIHGICYFILLSRNMYRHNINRIIRLDLDDLLRILATAALSQ